MADTGVSPTERVVVVTGAGGMGQAVARRLGGGCVVVLADRDRAALRSVASVLAGEGYRVLEQETDVSDPDSVRALADTARRAGRPEVLVHTAGVSPVQASVSAILQVDLYGTALMLDTFADVMAPGGAAVFIASMAGAMLPPDPELDRRLANTPTGDLLDLPELSPPAVGDPGTAYVMAKRANQVRVRAAAVAWGRRKLRVNSVSPGIIATPMGNAELEGANGEAMRAMIASSPTGRVGTPADIAAAVEFLTGPGASFVTGTDLLVDGGVVAALTA